MVKDEFNKNKEGIESGKFDFHVLSFDPLRRILEDKAKREIVLNLHDNEEIINALIFESQALGQVRLGSIDAVVQRGGRIQRLMDERTVHMATAGAMTPVPAGPFLYGDGKEPRSLDYDYEIGVFPVTNEEYCVFLNGKKPSQDELEKYIDLAGSFSNEKCRIIKEGDNYVVQKNFERHPVIYVSWYGADAYCQWKTDNNKDVTYRLPTEDEWEKAARGPDGWIYPWGDKFDSALCNSVESGIGATNNVDRYPEGKSFYGCYDMAGNVWEWCKDDESKNVKPLRGGSWGIGAGYCRCANRGGHYPDYRNFYFGFRCARTKK